MDNRLGVDHGVFCRNITVAISWVIIYSLLSGEHSFANGSKWISYRRPLSLMKQQLMQAGKNYTV
jgi:hypothetical protein